MTSTTALQPVVIPGLVRARAAQGHVGAILSADQLTVSFAPLIPQRGEEGRYLVLAFSRPLTEVV